MTKNHQEMTLMAPKKVQFVIHTLMSILFASELGSIFKQTKLFDKIEYIKLRYARTHSCFTCTIAINCQYNSNKENKHNTIQVLSLHIQQKDNYRVHFPLPYTVISEKLVRSIYDQLRSMLQVKHLIKFVNMLI